MSHRMEYLPPRPALPARDSSGRQVSLLNDEPSYPVVDMRRSASAHSSHPSTPDLLRSDSYDSSTYPADPLSPVTPIADHFDRSYPRSPQLPYYSHPSNAIYMDYSEKPMQNMVPSIRQQYDSCSYSSPNLYDDAPSSPQMGERQSKRYPCRFKDTHGCEKTFTTSGHASRHSKIHTAEKAVHCTFPDCHKKFTRADNMKQHLETHYKERSRVTHKSGSTALTMPAGIKKTSRPTSRTGRPELADVAQAFDARHMIARPVASRTDHGSSALDALAAVASRQ